jgi:hypothetical protein
MTQKVALVVLALGLFAGSARGADKAGVRLPDEMAVAGKNLVLNGMGVREATVFNVNVYVAGLYLEKKSANADEILGSEQVKRIEMVFVRDVDRKDITGAFAGGFKKNGGDMAALKERLDKLNGWMEAMKKGDSMAFTYVPEQGVTVSVKGKRKGTIEGADFGRAIFANYIGPKPPNSGLKRGLLGAK